MKKNVKLIGLYLEIISCCNQKCIYCYNEEIIKEKFELGFEVIQKLLLEAKKLGVNNITLSGGEPLLHDDFFEILDFCQKNKIDVYVITNATLIDEKIAKQLTYYNPDIQITLDSGIMDVHDLSRGKGTYIKQKRAIALLKEYGYQGNINMRTNIWKGNCNSVDLNSVFEFATQNNIKQIDIALAHETECFHESLKDSAKISSLSKIIIDLEKKFEKINVNYQEKEISIGCPFTGNEDTVGFNVRISPNGDVYPCQMFDQKQFAFGNINYLSIEEIINSDKCQKFLELMNLRKHFIPNCQGCGYQFLCNAGCPAKAIFYKGTIFSIDGSCTYRKNMLGKEMISLIYDNQI